MKDEFVSPLYDFVFAEIFGSQSNIDITVAFLKSVLDIPEDDYGRLTVVTPFLRRFFRSDKMGIVDLMLNTKSGRIIHIELQVDKQKDMRNRVLYYMARLVGDQLKWGDDYDKLHQVISIVICDHNMLKEENAYINEYELRNKENRSFTEMLKLVIMELPKLTETDDSTVWRWLRFLRCKKKEEFEMLANQYPELKKPVVCVKKMSIMEKWRIIRFHKNLWKVDERMRLEQALIDGREKGLAEGRAEGRAKGRAEGHLEKSEEIARMMKTSGYSLEEIAKITSLSPDFIEKL